jgi:S-adenosylmethionine uptake transporter
MTRAQALLPFLSVAAGIATFSTMDAVMKNASIMAGVYVAVIGRNVIGSALMAPIWRAAGGRWPRGAALRIHLLRSAVAACMAPLFFWGLVRVPMAEAMALSFIAPLIALYLAAVMLGETIRPAAVIASLLGVAGVAVIALARLGDETAGAGSGWGIAAILASAVFYAWNLILQRRQALLAGPIEVALFQNLFVALFFVPAAPWLFAWPTPQVLAWLTGGAVLAAAALMLLSWGYGRAEAQALVPLEYTGFVWASLFGWLWFGEALTLATVGGTALIVSGCWIALRRPVARAPLAEATPTGP